MRRTTLKRLLPLALVAMAAACAGDADAPAEEAGDPVVAAAPTAVDTARGPADSLPAAGMSDTAAGPTPSGPGADEPPARTPAVEPARPPGPSTAAPQPVPTQQPAGAGPTALLERAERLYADLGSMDADFRQQVYVPLLDQTQNSRGKLYHRSPDRFAMRFTEPAGDIVLADGRYIWMYYPSTDDRQVMRAVLSPGGQQVDLHREFLSDATSRFNVASSGTETIGGRQTTGLTLTPRGASPYSRVRLWIDNDNNLVRRFEITEENGTVRTLDLSNIRTNPTIANDVFVFTPPPGVQVHDF